MEREARVHAEVGNEAGEVMALREAGWRDTKSCAVSDRLTATRYHPA